MTPKIDHHIPIPTDKGGRGAAAAIQLPLAEMRIGDSVYAEGSHSRIRVTVGRWRDAHPGTAFTTRAEGAGLRVWRTA